MSEPVRNLPGLLLRLALAQVRLAWWAARYRLGSPRRLLRPTWRYGGECNGCGACCRSIRIALPRWLPFRQRLTPLVLAWAARSRPFLYHRGQLEPGELIFGCSYLSADNRCTVYAERPDICRLYPYRRPLRAPVLFEECGYEVVSVDPALEVPIAARLPEPQLIQITAVGGTSSTGFAGNRPPA